MKIITIAMFLISSSLFGLDIERESALNEIIAGIDKNRKQQLDSKFAKDNPELRIKINSLHDKIIADYRRDVTAGKVTVGSQVDKDIKEREESYKTSIEKGKEKAANNTKKVIVYLKWLVGDPSILAMPEKAVIY